MNSDQLEILGDISDIVRVLNNLTHLHTDPDTLKKAVSIWVDELNLRSSQLKSLTKTKN